MAKKTKLEFVRIGVIENLIIKKIGKGVLLGFRDGLSVIIPDSLVKVSEKGVHYMSAPSTFTFGVRKSTYNKETKKYDIQDEHNINSEELAEMVKKSLWDSVPQKVEEKEDSVEDN